MDWGTTISLTKKEQIVSLFVDTRALNMQKSLRKVYTNIQLDGLLEYEKNSYVKESLNS